ncbi:hypothetical protein [Halalkalibacter sp. APA_J-10(15)]|uniref:hypothetical protein n=1 Tax=Halalkalibacter sp. APA_J-10(15) TaxID=2933805 RepID=UPI001FF1CABB|nr:hypothetical protein [Halalkalibacter sp. APA_J-10(15)]MCK0470274.1 hypothetical protein [Halalkalibacter sp. APA_J-10(15)]
MENKTKNIETLIEELKKGSNEVDIKIDSIQKIMQESNTKQQTVIRMQDSNTKQLIKVMTEQQNYLREQNKELLKRLLWIVGGAILIIASIFGIDIEL